eukprot:SAG22_NODE_571_length_9011_cov_292.011670_8_plen_162_part_00
MSVSTRLPEAWRCHLALAGDYLVLAVQPLREEIQVEVKQVEVVQVKQVEVVQVKQVEVVQVKQALGKEVEEIQALVKVIQVEKVRVEQVLGEEVEEIQVLVEVIQGEEIRAQVKEIRALVKVALACLSKPAFFAIPLIICEKILKSKGAYRHHPEAVGCRL